MTNNKERHPMVSVIIPAYNREKLILRAIISLDKQTYQDFEILVINDASTDNTEKVVKNLNHPKIKYLKLERNSGQCAARNKGIYQAKGKYIGFLDSDDEWLPTKLEKQIAVFESSSDEQLGAVYCGHIEKDEVYNFEKTITRKKYRGNLYEKILNGFCPATPSMFLVKKQVLFDVNSFDENLPTFVDIDLWLRVAQKGFTFDYVDEPLIVKHEHKGEQIAKNLDKRLKGLEIFSKKWGSEIIRISGHKHYQYFRKSKVQAVVTSIVDNPPKNYRREIKQSLSSLIKYRIFNVKQYVKIFIILIFGKKVLNLIQQNISHGI